jgi:predicted amidohydrolase YtcJ
VNAGPRHNLPDTPMRLVRGKLMLLLLAIAGTVLAQQPTPDLILSNGKIITVDERFTIAQAVAIQGDRIMASAPIRRWLGLRAPTRRIDLRGRAVIPGLIDNHMHLLRAATTWLRETPFRRSGVAKQAIEMLRARAKAAGPGEWVYNIGGWTHQQFVDDPKPFTREELDRSRRTIR